MGYGCHNDAVGLGHGHGGFGSKFVFLVLLAFGHAVDVRRRYRKEVRACVMAQRLRKDPRKRKAARRGHRRLRTIA